MDTVDDLNARLRATLNARVTEMVERSWPTVHREMSRMARARWELAPLGKQTRRRWKIVTTLRLLEAPAPSEIERALGIASAVAHIEVQCLARGVVEAWTLTFRAFGDHDEMQMVGAETQVSRDVSLEALRRLLRDGALSGPGVYPLGALAAPSTQRRRQQASEV